MKPWRDETAEHYQKRVSVQCCIELAIWWDKKAKEELIQSQIVAAATRGFLICRDLENDGIL